MGTAFSVLPTLFMPLAGIYPGPSSEVLGWRCRPRQPGSPLKVPMSP